MPYTTQGFMTAADIRDYEEQTDTGSIIVYLDDTPVWFDTSGDCPACDKPIVDHESVTVGSASGEIWYCSEGY